MPGLAAYVNQSVAPLEYVNVAEADVVAAAIRMYSHTYRMYGIPLQTSGLSGPRVQWTVFPCRVQLLGRRGERDLCRPR